MYKLLILSVFWVFGAMSAPVHLYDSLDSKLNTLSGEDRVTFLLTAGRENINSHPAQAIRYASEALKLGGGMGNGTFIAEANLILSEAYLSLGKSDSALFFARRAVDKYEKVGEPIGKIKSVNQLGVVYLNKGNHDEAEKYFIQAFVACNDQRASESSEEKHEELAAEVFNNLMVAYIQQGNYKKAKIKLLQFSKQNDFGKSYAGMVIQGNLSTIYQMLGEYDSAHYYARQALEIAKILKEPRNIGKGYTDLGNIYYTMGRYGDAIEMFNKGVETLLPIHDEQRLSKLYNNIAASYKQIGYYEKATAFFLQSLKFKMNLGDSMGMAATYNNMGLVYKDLENNKMAEHYLRLAVKINQKMHNRKQLSTNYIGLGDLFLGLKQADTALFYFQKALELKREIGHKYGMIIALHGIGNVYSSLMQDDAEARGYFEDALQLATQLGSHYEVAKLNISLGELFFKERNLSKASVLFRQALDYAQREDALELMETASRYLTEISIEQGDGRAAMAYFQRFRMTGDSLFNRDKTRAITEMQTRFETEKKEHENTMLLKENKLQKRQIFLLVLFTVVLTLFGIIIYYLYYQKVRASRKIVQKNVELVKVEREMEARSQHASKAHSEVSAPRSIDEISNTNLGLLVKLTRLMAEEKPYLEPGITIEDICRRIGTNRTYLSQLINENFNQNFSCYLNEFRIKEARRLLTERKNDNISIEGIGMMSGFNSKMTFHTQFKQQVGVTPSYFRKSVYQISYDT